MVMGELLGDPAIRAWAIACAIVALKILGAGVYTSIMRMRSNIFISPEDFSMMGLDIAEALDPDVERARRIHQNDLESGVPFLLVGFAYALTSPSTLGLWICFAGYPVARILHSIAYARQLMPHRTIAFMLGFLITLWMAIAILIDLVF